MAEVNRPHEEGKKQYQEEWQINSNTSLWTDQLFPGIPGVLTARVGGSFFLHEASQEKSFPASPSRSSTTMNIYLATIICAPPHSPGKGRKRKTSMVNRFGRMWVIGISINSLLLTLTFARKKRTGCGVYARSLSCVVYVMLCRSTSFAYSLRRRLRSGRPKRPARQGRRPECPG